MLLLSLFVLRHFLREFLHFLPLLAQLFSGCCDFLPQSDSTHVRFLNESQVPVVVSVTHSVGPEREPVSWEQLSNPAQDKTIQMMKGETGRPKKIPNMIYCLIRVNHSNICVIHVYISVFKNKPKCLPCNSFKEIGYWTLTIPTMFTT